MMACICRRFRLRGELGIESAQRFRGPGNIPWGPVNPGQQAVMIPQTQTNETQAIGQAACCLLNTVQIQTCFSSLFRRSSQTARQNTAHPCATVPVCILLVVPGTHGLDNHCTRGWRRSGRFCGDGYLFFVRQSLLRQPPCLDIIVLRSPAVWHSR